MATVVTDVIKSVFADGPTSNPEQVNKARVRQEVGPTIDSELDRITNLAFEAGDVYANTAAGLAGTTIGQQFRVASADPNVASYTYRHDSGPVATLIATTPSVAALATKADASALAVTAAQTTRADDRSGALSSGFSRSLVFGASSPATGDNAAGSIQFVHAAATPGAGVLRQVTLYSMVAALVEISIFSRSDADLFARLRYKTAQTVVGLNTFQVDLPFDTEQYIGLRSDTAGFISTLTVDNIGHFAGTLSSGTFTDSTSAPTVQLQASFAIDVFNRQPIVETLTDISTASGFVGLQTTPATGTNFPTGTLVLADPVKEDGYLDYIEMTANAGANIEICLFERFGITLVKAQRLRRLTVSKTGVNHIDIQADVRAGQLIGFRSPDSGWATSVAVTGANPHYRADTVVDSFDQAAAFTGSAPQIRVVVRTKYASSVNRVTLDNASRLVIISSSYAAGGAWTLKDKHWVAAFSAASDFNVEVMGIGGSTMRHMLNTRVRSNQSLPPILAYEKGIRDYRGTTFFVEFGWNDAFSGTLGVSYAQYLQDSREMIESLRSLGGQVVASHEWQPAYDRANPVTQIGIELLCREMGVDFINPIPNTLRVRGSSPFYAGFWDSGGATSTNHQGARSGYILSDEFNRLLRTVMPRTQRSVKIFRPRSGFSTIDDLIFGDRYGRTKRWREISLQHRSMLDPTKVDAVNESADSELIRSEYLALRGGQAISISDYALIDAVIDGQIGTINDLSLVLGDPSLTVYVRDALFSTTAADYPTNPPTVCKWTAVAGDGNGRFTIPSASLPGKLHGDNVSFLVYKSGGFSLSAPVVEWRGGCCKSVLPRLPEREARGAAILPVSTFVDGSLTGWTVTGAPAVSTDKTYQFPRDSVARIITMGTSDSIEQPFTYSIDPVRGREAEIVVTARHFPALGSITSDSFDLAQVLVGLVFHTTGGVGADGDGNYVMLQQVPVGLWWKNCTVRFTVPPIAGLLSLRVRVDTANVQIAEVTAQLVD
ncbi:hypothetical protein GR138_12675 [Shinella kummerowiae]|uniref:Uncharacterized protein n=1 Tax=Shinella kummerowiae TaxID=417745 RepID=A0A6N8SAE9_9HYPH|nr:hypothetical protein [Shinella kummerowiae]MXN46045.1 hypothetical protein [Shinella kummerowiae]